MEKRRKKAAWRSGDCALGKYVRGYPVGRSEAVRLAWN